MKKLRVLVLMHPDLVPPEDAGKLSEEERFAYKTEWDVMRTHPQVGYDLVRKLPHLAGAAEIVLAHHEAFDGSGYPNGLKGKDIPLCARILTIADSYDSMTHPHTQRPAMPAAMAVREVERCSGSQFDPDAVAALGHVLQRATVHAQA